MACKDIEHRQEYCKKYRTDPENREKRRKYLFEYYARQGPDIRWKRQLRKIYKITSDRYVEMLNEQNGVCAICGHPPRIDEKRCGEGTTIQGDKWTYTPKGKLCIDHDHECCPGAKSCGNCIRGLLCSRCNKALGGFKDDFKLLASAIKYLLKKKIRKDN
jgi:Recombination endonuclease VII